ncbi:Uncharacterised protein [Vibrio cholerae]|nr:Uncharacterised protein [Vibrio cholerae]CSI05594.1 Uncharacterised protein [Vibrio cholerae]
MQETTYSTRSCNSAVMSLRLAGLSSTAMTHSGSLSA